MGSLFVHGSIAAATIGLIAIPIIIHLINRRRFRRVDWAAMEFLLLALKKNRRRVKIEQLILLLLRVALMALLGLAIARPMVSGGLGWLGSALRSEEKVFVVDDSFSASVRHANRSVFEYEIEAVASALDHLVERRGGDRVTIVRGSRFQTPLVRRGVLDREQVDLLTRKLNNLKPSDTSLPLAGVLDYLATDHISSSDEATPRPLAISILSDLRRSDWTDGSGGPNKAIETALARLRDSESAPTRIVVVDVGEEETTNVAITSAFLSSGRAIAGVPTEFTVELENFGPAAVHDIRLSLRYAPITTAQGSELAWVDLMGPAAAPIASGEVVRYSIPCTFRSTGPHAVEIRAAGHHDLLEGDDVYPVAVDVVDAIDLLLVSGEPSSEPFDGETDFLEAALSPSSDSLSGLRPSVVVEEGLEGELLDRYAMVFLCNVFTVPEGFLERVRRHVTAGGTAIVFLGDQVDASLYNQVFAASSAVERGASGETSSNDSEAATPVKGLLPGRLGEIRRAQAGEAFRLIPDLDHRYFRSLRDVTDAMSDVDFQQFFHVTPTAHAQVIAHYSDADESPAILEAAVGDGRVLLFTSSADAEWNSWQRNPSFLVLLQDIVSSVAGARQVRPSYLAGHPLTVPVDIARYAQEATLRSPGFPSVPERTLVAAPVLLASPGAGNGAATGADFQFSTPDTHRFGHYGLSMKTKEGEEAWRVFAIRRPREESDLRRVQPAKLEELYPDAELTVVARTTAFADVGRGRFEIADVLLLLFGALLLVEGFCAWRFAHHANASAAPGVAATGSRRN